MNKSLQLIPIFIIAFLSFRPSEAQNKIIKGYVTTFDSIPLINAEVMSLSYKTVVYSIPSG